MKFLYLDTILYSLYGVTEILSSFIFAFPVIPVGKINMALCYTNFIIPEKLYVAG